MTPTEKRLKAQEDKARARVYAAGAAMPEALGGDGSLPEQPAHLEPDDLTTARAEARAALQASKAQARLVAAGLDVPVTIEPSGDWPRVEPEPEPEPSIDSELELEERRAEGSRLEALIAELGALGSRCAALEARVSVLEAVVDDSPEPERSSNSRSGYACGCDPDASSSPHRPLLNFYACENYPDCAFGKSQGENH